MPAPYEKTYRLPPQFSPHAVTHVQSTQACDVATSIDHIDLFYSEQFKRLNLVQGIQLKCCSFISKHGDTTDGALNPPRSRSGDSARQLSHPRKSVLPRNMASSSMASAYKIKATKRVSQKLASDLPGHLLNADPAQQVCELMLKR